MLRAQTPEEKLLPKNAGWRYRYSSSLGFLLYEGYTKIQLRWIHNPEISAGGGGIGEAETRMIEGVEGFAAHLYFPVFAQPEILVDSKIQYVHAASSNIRPTGGIAPHIVSEVGINPVSRVTGTGWFVIGPWEILHARPGGVERHCA